MAIARRVFGVLALALLSQVAIALPDRRAPQITAAPTHTCYIHTETIPYTGHMYCPMEKACSAFFTSTCTGPAAMVTEMVDIPSPDAKCPVTSTVTVTGAGKCGHCQSDCGTETVTKTTRYNCPMMTAPAPVGTDSWQIG